MTTATKTKLAANTTTTKASKAEAVVLNDNYKKQTLATLNDLVSKRENWETTVYRKSNEMLYAILQSCFAVNHAMIGNEKEAKARRAALAQFTNEKGYRFTESTPVITKVVKCVFGVDRRRVSAYSLVLREAIKQNVMLKDLPSWIEENGGVEQIRLSKAPNAKTPKQKAEAAKSVMNQSEVLCVAKSKALSKVAEAEFAEEDCVLLATQQADGSFTIRAVIRSKGAVNAALISYLTQTKAVVSNDTKKTEAANDSKMREEAINKAAA
ncbi:MAG: hypothetical protein ABL920_06730 [Methylotenera sp.]